MKFAVKYRLKREKGTIFYTATFSRIVRKKSFKLPLKDDIEYLNWVLIPEWIKQGIVFLPVKDFNNIEKHVYIEVYSFTKKENDEFSFEVINASKDDIEELLVTDKTDRFALALSYDKFIESGKFTLDQLVRKKIITKEIKRQHRVPAPDLEFDD